MRGRKPWHELWQRWRPGHRSHQAERLAELGNFQWDLFLTHDMFLDFLWNFSGVWSFCYLTLGFFYIFLINGIFR